MINLNLQNLQYVLEIINYGSISAAARKLYISQSYLSKILMEVEKEYGIVIFSREKNNLVLTERGASFALTIREVLDTMKGFDRTLHHLQNVSHFTFSSCPTAYTAEAYFDFLQAKQDTPFRVHYKEGDNNTVINDVYTRISEMGVIILNNEECQATTVALKSMRIAYEKFFDLEFYIIARIGHPLTRLMRPVQIDDLYDYDFVLYPQHRLMENNAVGTAEYEYSFDQIEWKRIRHITYVQSRAQYYDLIQRTDTISFGFRPLKSQESTRNIVSLRVAPDFMQVLKKDANSSLYLIYMEGHKLSELAAGYCECLRKQGN